jgi:hypothetical protein
MFNSWGGCGGSRANGDALVSWLYLLMISIMEDERPSTSTVDEMNAKKRWRRRMRKIREGKRREEKRREGKEGYRERGRKGKSKRRSTTKMERRWR